MRPFVAAIFLSVLILGGCKKKDDGLGSNILPEEILLGLNHIDTLSLYATTQLDDSVRADDQLNVMLGSINDPEFGSTRVGFYTQLRSSQSSVAFDVENIEVDSVVLSVVYDEDQYGSNYAQEFEVYELSEQMYSDSAYFSSRTLSHKSQDLVLPESRVQVPAPDQMVHLANDTVDPQLRLRLNSEFGEKVINQTDSLNNYFSEFIKGLYVTVSDQDIPPGSGGIHYYDLLDSDSKVTLYYTETTGDESEQKEFELLINSNAVYFSRPTHDYSMANSDLMAQLAGDESSGQHTVFIQAAAGLRTEISIPHLEQLSNDTMAINKAELVIPIAAFTDFPPPDRVYVLGRNAEGTAFFLPDFLEGDAHMGGFLNQVDLEYRLNISRWVQQVLQGSRENAPLEIVSQWAASTANRAILHGPEHADRQMRLVVHYTKY